MTTPEGERNEAFDGERIRTLVTVRSDGTVILHEPMTGPELLSVLPKLSVLPEPLAALVRVSESAVTNREENR